MPSFEIGLALFILGLTILGFVLEKLPADLVALLSLTSLMVTGLITPEEGFSGFSHPVTITLAALFVLSAGLQSSGLLEGLTVKLQKLFARRFKLALVLLMTLVAVLSAFINNTAVVALFLPVVMDVCRRHKVSPSKVLLPLSYASMFGGLCTLVGTSTNLIVSDISSNLTGQPFSMFETASIGMLLTVVGVGYTATLGVHWLVPRREGQQLTSDFDMSHNLHNVRLQGNSPSAPLQGWRQLNALKPDLLALNRAAQPRPRPGLTSVLEGDDLLTVRADQFPDQSQEYTVEGGSVTDEMLDDEESALVEILVSPGSQLNSQSLQDSGLADQSLVPLAIRRPGIVHHRGLPARSLHEGDTVLYSVSRDQMYRFQTRPFTVLSAPASTHRKKKTAAALVLAAVVLCASFGWLPISLASTIGALAIILLGCITLEQAYRAVEWKVVTLLAAMFGLGLAMERTGATRWLADSFLLTVNDPRSALLALYLLTVVMTSFLSNGATAVLLAPIAAAVAGSMQVDPRPFLITVALAASSCFMSPVGYQTHLMVYNAGHYRFADFFKVGFPLNLLFAVVTVALVPFFWPLT